MGKGYDSGETKNSGKVIRGVSSSNSKAKNSKSKTPQRGLGVAQLEKLRLNGQLDINPFLNLKQKEEVRMQSVCSSMSSSVSVSVSCSLPASAYSASDQLFPYNFVMTGAGDRHQSSNIIYGDSWTSSWNPVNNVINFQQCTQPKRTRHPSKPVFKDIKEDKIKKQRSSSSVESSTTQNSESIDTKLDLELRLSI